MSPDAKTSRGRRLLFRTFADDGVLESFFLRLYEVTNDPTDGCFVTRMIVRVYALENCTFFKRVLKRIIQPRLLDASRREEQLNRNMYIIINIDDHFIFVPPSRTVHKHVGTLFPCDRKIGRFRVRISPIRRVREGLFHI